MEEKNLDELVLRFFQILDSKEENRSGHMFSPTYIYSCRVLVMEELEELLPDMKDAAYRDKQAREMREMNI